ncbi:hypothetical protein M513_13582 [Trichuris suis]|uniref:Uncharacterized protein n=1 Tax=Trichuris suis TaxID=68888 RepID=A0A085LKN9_9BILA|nr:hypothetical protein M513_13582 [Trichuris suis]
MLVQLFHSTDASFPCCTESLPLLMQPLPQRHVAVNALVALKGTVWGQNKEAIASLSTFSANSPNQLDVLCHNRHPASMDGAQIRVFKQADHVCFSRLLQSQYA